MTTDIKILNKIPDNTTKVSYSKGDKVVIVELQDDNGHTLLTQPINVVNPNDVSDVTFSKNYNIITIKFVNGNETNISIGRHLLLNQGDLQLTKGIDCVVQQINVGLHLLIGDWVLDSTAGVDYFGGMRAYPEILNAQIKKAINTVVNVDTVLKYKFIENNDNIFNVSGTVKVGNTEIPINTNVIPTQKGL